MSRLIDLPQEEVHQVLVRLSEAAENGLAPCGVGEIIALGAALPRLHEKFPVVALDTDFDMTDVDRGSIFGAHT